uniref:Uncharacterized protein n=1 Tax=Sinocyclocheilus grahami TaxID=75366 RepID=A0A672QXZ3_SINGR
MTDEGCSIVTSLKKALKSNPSHLRELNLSGNKLGDSGVKNLSDLLMNPQFKLKGCDITDEGCSALTSALKSNPSHLRELDLRMNELGDSGVKNLRDLLMSPQCKLEILDLCGCSITHEQCLILTSALKSNPSHLRELDLSENQIKNTGAHNCLILTSALKSNPSHLRELDLSENQIKNTGMSHLCDILNDSHCKLERLSLNQIQISSYIVCLQLLIMILSFCLSFFSLNFCGITDKKCFILTTALKTNPSHLRELNLSVNQIKSTGVNHLCETLKDVRCKLERLRLNDCNLTDKSCSALAPVLGSDTSLKELNMNNNNLQDSGVKLLCTGLENVKCELELLCLRKCGLTEESCSALATVLRSNSSLKELDMSNNNLQDSGVKKLQNGLENTNCTLQKLR